MFKKALSGLLSLAMILTMIVSAPLIASAEVSNVLIDFENYNIGQYPSVFKNFSNGSGLSNQKVMEVDYGSTKTKAFRIISGSNRESAHYMDLQDEPMTSLVLTANIKPLSNGKLGELSLNSGLTNTSLLPKLIFDNGKLYSTDKDSTNSLKEVGVFQKDNWYNVILSVNLVANTYDLHIDGVLKAQNLKIDDVDPDKVFLMTYKGTTNEMYFDNIGLYKSINDIPEKMELKISGNFTVKNKVFDGTKVAEFLTNNLILTGIVPGHTVALDDVVLNFQTPDVGTDIQVNIISASLTGSDAMKYKLSLEGAPTTKASITPANHIVIFGVQGGNGILTATHNSINFISGNTVLTHSNVIFTATPNTGYKVKEWIINNEKYVSTVQTHTLLNIKGNMDVKVVFEPITAPVTKYTVTFEVTGGTGTMAAFAGGLNIQSPALVDKSQDLIFVANPSTGYKVKEWQINGIKVNTDNINVLTVNNLNKNIAVKLVLTSGVTPIPDDDEDEDSYPAAPAIANSILKKYNISNRYVVGMHKNNKPMYGNYISLVARESKGNTFKGVSKFNKAEYYNAVYQFLKLKGADLP